MRDAERRLEPEHAEGSSGPLTVLVLMRMRGVIGRDRIDRAVGHGQAQRGNIIVRSQRRVDLVDRVIARDEILGEKEVVRCHLGSHVDAPALGPPDDLDRSRGRHVAHMQS